MDKYNDYAHIATATTTLVRGGQCVLGKIVFNDATTAAVTIFDDIVGSGDVLAIYPAGILAGTEIELQVAMNKGITVVTAGADDITVTFTV